MLERPNIQLHDNVFKWKTFFALLALCAGNSPVTGEFPSQRPVTWNFDVLFDLRLEQTVKWTIIRLVIWDAIPPSMTPL